MVKKHTLAFFDGCALVALQNGSFSIFYFNSTDVAACVPVENLSMKI